MQKRYLPITVVVCLLAAAALAGYLTPVKAQKLPVRILFQNNGGRVIFSHLRHHKNYQIACADCHHEANSDHGQPQPANPSEPLPCGSCHPASFDKDYVAEHVNSFPDKSYCVKCHHAEFGVLAFDHEAHKEYASEDCQTCHHGPDIEAEPGHCNQCHNLAGSDSMPSLRDAAHKRCETCHDDLFDKGIKGCAPCHKMKDMKGYKGSYTPCQQCHRTPSPDRELVLTRTNAFHDQCMNCHKGLKKGPYGENECGKCHIR
ncbi:MAG: cytochrome c3 family protein [Desulfovibrio sp.]